MNMKVDKFVYVHDPEKELYDKVYGIYKLCGGASSILELIFEFLILSLPILNLAFTLFFKESGFLFLSLIILFVIILFFYQKIIDNKISKRYIQKFNLKPDNYNLFCNFVSECRLKGVRLFEIESVIDFVEVDSDFKEVINIFIPILMTIFSKLMTEYVNKYIESNTIKADEVFAICCLAISIYMLVKYMLFHRKKINYLRFKKCLIYAKIALRKDEIK